MLFCMKGNEQKKCLIHQNVDKKKKKSEKQRGWTKETSCDGRLGKSGEKTHGVDGGDTFESLAEYWMEKAQWEKESWVFDKKLR